MKLTSIRKASLLLAAAALLSPLTTAKAEPEEPAVPAVDAPDIPAGDTHAKVMEDMLKSVNKMAGILTTAKDEETAKAAVTQLGKLEEPMKKLAKRAKALGDPDAELEKKLEEKFKPQLTEAMGKMMKASMELASKPELMKIIQPGLDKIGTIMSDM